jgi:hypothetical protein
MAYARMLAAPQTKIRLARFELALTEQHDPIEGSVHRLITTDLIVSCCAAPKIFARLARQRDRNYYVAATCIQRIFVSVDWKAGAIKSLNIPRPICAEL